MRDVIVLIFLISTLIKQYLKFEEIHGVSPCFKLETDLPSIENFDSNHPQGTKTSHMNEFTKSLQHKSKK